MKTAKGLFGAVVFLTLAACVTINIYFPAAAAEKAADKVIDEVWGEKPAEESAPEAPSPSSRLDNPSGPVLAWLLEAMIPAANAASVDINVSTPAINKIKASMKARHAKLETYYASGAVGLTADGLVVVRSAGDIPLKKRRRVNQLTASENRDRNTLYREIATANRHPEWEGDIRKTFARRWVNKARRGWWYQDGSGRWHQK